MMTTTSTTIRQGVGPAVARHAHARPAQRPRVGDGVISEQRKTCVDYVATTLSRMTRKQPVVHAGCSVRRRFPRQLGSRCGCRSLHRACINMMRMVFITCATPGWPTRELLQLCRPVHGCRRPLPKCRGPPSFTLVFSRAQGERSRHHRFSVMCAWLATLASTSPLCRMREVHSSSIEKKRKLLNHLASRAALEWLIRSHVSPLSRSLFLPCGYLLPLHST